MHVHKEVYVLAPDDLEEVEDRLALVDEVVHGMAVDLDDDEKGDA